MGVNWGTNQATQGFTSLIEGDLVRVTGVVGMFSGATQFQPLNNNAITVLNSTFPTITPKVVPVSDLNDQNQINNIVDGHEWEGTFSEVQNVTITAVNVFGSGTSRRLAAVSPRYLVIKPSSWMTYSGRSSSAASRSRAR